MLDKLAVERDVTTGRVGKIVAEDNTVDADVGIDVGADVGINVGADVGINVGADVDMNVGADVGASVAADIEEDTDHHLIV